jgi:hypothetical protein
MKLQPLFVRRSLAAIVALTLAFGVTVTSAAAAGALLAKPGLPKTTTTAALPALSADTLTQAVEADPQAVEANPQAELTAFAQAVVDGRANVLRGVFVPGVLALQVVQQPAGAFSLNMSPGVATQFSAASAYGVTGLLADNIASGVEFYELAPGQEVTLIYGDGALRRYIVDGIARFQALSPSDPYSDFIDLASGARLSSSTLFSQMYSGGDKVTFQTCLAQDGLMTWGRLFVTAHPAP